MKTFISLMTVVLFLTISGGIEAEEIRTDAEENEIISSALEQLIKGRSFFLVSSLTVPLSYYTNKKKDFKRTREYIKKKLKLPKKDAEFLLIKFFKKNERQAVLTLDPKTAKGYVIDRKFKKKPWFKYFPLMLKEYPEAKLAVQVSRPLYDKKSGVLLFYYDWMGGPHYAQSQIVQFEYQNGKLREVSRVVLSVS